MASELRVDKIITVDGIGTDTSTVTYGGGIVQIVEVGHTSEHTITATSPQQIFSGSIPYWLMMLVVMILVVIFPGLASWLTTFV